MASGPTGLLGVRARHAHVPSGVVPEVVQTLHLLLVANNATVPQEKISFVPTQIVVVSSVQCLFKIILLHNQSSKRQKISSFGTSFYQCVYEVHLP